jgi:hypothetical protein
MAANRSDKPLLIRNSLLEGAHFSSFSLFFTLLYQGGLREGRAYTKAGRLTLWTGEKLKRGGQQ